MASYLTNQRGAFNATSRDELAGHRSAFDGKKHRAVLELLLHASPKALVRPLPIDPDHSLELAKFSGDRAIAGASCDK